MSLHINIDRQSSKAIYQQIVTQIQTQINDGLLPEGTRLPPVRQLARQLGLTRLTVHNAYSELQADGWVEGIVGRGTFVSKSPQSEELVKRFGLRITREDLLENLHSLKQVNTVLSMAHPDPDPNLFPTTDFWDSLAGMRPQAAAFLQYASPQGESTLRIELANFMRDRGVEAMPDEIIVTTGVTQAISLISQALTSPGDKVMVEEPGYFLLLHILKTQRLQPVTVPIDEFGPQLDQLEQRIIEHRPRFYYTVPSFHNPTGYVWSEERRIALLELAKKYNFIIVEDDIYGQLAYDSPAPQALKALDVDGHVVFMSSFSKTLLPGIRIGYMMMPPDLKDKILKLKLASDMFSPTFVQRALADFLNRGKFKAHLRRVLPIYKNRRDAMMNALQRYMPHDVTWTYPLGSFSCWVTLPEDERITKLYPAALERGIAFTPGEVFLTNTDPISRHLRLCYSSVDEDAIDEGVRRLSELIRERLRQPVHLGMR